MTNHNWHYAQSLHNEKLSLDVLRTTQSEYNDWSITSMFYSALHLINAHCMDCDMPIPTTHFERTEMVKNNLSHIREAYQNLLALSMQSRYTTPYSDMSESDIKNAYAWLVKIKKHISS